MLIGSPQTCFELVKSQKTIFFVDSEDVSFPWRTSCYRWFSFQMWQYVVVIAAVAAAAIFHRSLLCEVFSSFFIISFEYIFSTENIILNLCRTRSVLYFRYLRAFCSVLCTIFTWWLSFCRKRSFFTVINLIVHILVMFRIR